MSAARDNLIGALTRSLAAQAHRREAGVVEHIRALETWQKRRLLRSYADFVDHPRFREATAFFSDDLYAPGDLEARDQDIERMTPLLVRMLPADTVQTVADAIDLQALTLELDFAMIEHLPEAIDAIEGMDVEDYAAAYRTVGSRELRERQIAFIIRVGWELDGLVTNPLIGATLRLARTRKANGCRVSGFAANQAGERTLDRPLVLRAGETEVETTARGLGAVPTPKAARRPCSLSLARARPAARR